MRNIFQLINAVSELSLFCTKCIYTSIHFQRVHSLYKFSMLQCHQSSKADFPELLPPAPSPAVSRLTGPHTQCAACFLNIMLALHVLYFLSCIFTAPPFFFYFYFFPYGMREIQVKVSSTLGVLSRGISRLHCVALPEPLIPVLAAEHQVSYKCPPSIQRSSSIN